MMTNELPGTAIDLSDHRPTRSSLKSRASRTQHWSSQTLTQMHQTTLPRGKHHVADPNDPSTGAVVEDDGTVAVESAVAAGAARTSRGAAITVAARVLTILLDILLPHNELYDVRVVGRAAELPDWGSECVTCRSTLRHAIRYLMKYMMRPIRNAHSGWPTAAASTGPNRTSFVLQKASTTAYRWLPELFISCGVGGSDSGQPWQRSSTSIASPGRAAR